MKQTQRHDAIIELVKKQGYVSTEELVEQFAVSPQTIRRDLNDLAEQKMILRHHGGAGAALQLGEHLLARSQSDPDGGKRAYRPAGSQRDPRRGRRCLLISAPRRKRWRTPCSITTICALSPIT